MHTILTIDIGALDSVLGYQLFRTKLFSFYLFATLETREFKNRFPSYIGLGLYWEYEGTT